MLQSRVPDTAVPDVTESATLTGKQRHHLRGLGHALRPIVQIGRDGITDAVIAATNQALDDHELIKVKVSDAAELDRNEAAEELASRTQSHLAQVLGFTFLLYRAHPDKPVIAF